MKDVGEGVVLSDDLIDISYFLDMSEIVHFVLVFFHSISIEILYKTYQKADILSANRTMSFRIMQSQSIEGRCSGLGLMQCRKMK